MHRARNDKVRMLGIFSEFGKDSFEIPNCISTANTEIVPTVNNKIIIKYPPLVHLCNV